MAESSQVMFIHTESWTYLNKIVITFAYNNIHVGISLSRFIIYAMDFQFKIHMKSCAVDTKHYIECYIAVQCVKTALPDVCIKFCASY